MFNVLQNDILESVTESSNKSEGEEEERIVSHCEMNWPMEDDQDWPKSFWHCSSMLSCSIAESIASQKYSCAFSFEKNNKNISNRKFSFRFDITFSTSVLVLRSLCRTKSSRVWAFCEENIGLSKGRKEKRDCFQRLLNRYSIFWHRYRDSCSNRFISLDSNSRS